MVREALQYLLPKQHDLIVDATLGGGGHARAILETSKTANLIGIDQDDEAIAAARENLKEFGDRITFVKSNFSDIKSIASGQKISGILFDLGVSSHQIDTSGRGFSFREDAPLDMRMNKTLQASAKDLVNDLDQRELERIIMEYGEERFFRRIASAIIKARPVNSTLQLADIIKFSIPKSTPQNTTKSIARVFQALRIAVNSELDSLKTALEEAIDLLSPKGRIVVISYHSLEDRIVKETFKRESVDCLCPPKQMKCTCEHKKKLVIITRKPVIAGDEEVRENPRARSAKLRAAEKI
jgi:16S rRNA (cytosine1402-N4)-methyltransferase